MRFLIASVSLLLRGLQFISLSLLLLRRAPQRETLEAEVAAQDAFTCFTFEEADEAETQMLLMAGLGRPFRAVLVFAWMHARHNHHIRLAQALRTEQCFGEVARRQMSPWPRD